MISKAIPSNSFYHTCRYICNRQEATVLVSEGVRAHDYKLMADDFLMQQQMRPSKKQACFHAILSFFPGEKPSDEIMKEIATKYLEHLGIVNTQYTVCKHTDKAHLHLHIVANLVNNDGKTISDSYIGLRGKKIAQKLTHEYQLTPALEKNLELTHLENLNEIEAAKYQIYIAIAENLPYCHSLEELETRLSKQGIDILYKYKCQTMERQGVSFRMGKFSFKGSQVDRKFSLMGLEKAISLRLKTEGSLQLKKEKPFHQVVNAPMKNKGNFSGTSGRSLAGELTKDTIKLVEELIQAEETYNQMPYDLTYEGYKKKLKKRGRRHKR